MSSEVETPATSGSAELIPVEVVYAKPQVQRLIALQLPVGSTLWQAVRQSGLLEQCPELAARGEELRGNVGIFGKPVPADSVLQAGDRVEIYRPLLIDPKEARRLRAEKKAQPG